MHVSNYISIHDVIETTYQLHMEGEDGKAETIEFSMLYEYAMLNVQDFDAKGDGLVSDTAAIQATILSCPTESER